MGALAMVELQETAGMEPLPRLPNKVASTLAQQITQGSARPGGLVCW
jgi:hypothetical protein